MRISSPRGRALTCGLLALISVSPLCCRPARALEEIQLRLPLLETNFSIKVSELGSRQKLWQGNSDLAELDRASNGALGRQLEQLFDTPLPLRVKKLVANSAGTPLFEQALLVASILGKIDGLPNRVDGEQLNQALEKAKVNGELTVLGLIQALPGHTATLDLQPALRSINRLRRQQTEARQLAASQPAVSVDPRMQAAGPLALQQSKTSLVVKHRPAPLEMEVIRPSQGGNGQLVVISHGLWDGPTSFEGWARHLASHGYTVILPFHPGSDHSQQQAMLSGSAPPPGPEELKLRPLDVSAVIDGVAAGQIAGLNDVKADRVVVIGHSWGATTALQLAGATPSSLLLKQRCSNFDDPGRNLSWVLQCSFLDAADRAGLVDPRVMAVAAVSPPLQLVFAPGSSMALQARVLLVSGSQDWVVPADPEAIDPFRTSSPGGHDLVLVAGGDHFNLRGPQESSGGPLRGLLLAWVDGAFAAGSAVRPAPAATSLLPTGGWGDPEMALVRVAR
ncbi:MAG: alpha/beta fold hydrolase [Synechococcaceae cyanobacterium ELA263]